jgi:uncharacterized protein (TIGR02996 family)
MGQRERLLRAVEANPGENAPLLAYAEWLDRFARVKGRFRTARAVASIRGFLDFSDQVAGLVSATQILARDPRAARLVTREQTLRRQLLKKLLSGLTP